MTKFEGENDNMKKILSKFPRPKIEKKNINICETFKKIILNSLLTK